MTTLLLKHYLKVNEVKQSSLAAIAGVSTQLLNYWVKGSREDIYVEYSVLTGHVSEIFAKRVLFADKEKALDIRNAEG